MFKLILLLIAFIFIGCNQTNKHYIVKYKGLECKSLTDVGIKWDGKKYVCVGNYIREPKKKVVKRKIAIKKQPTKREGCETTITEIFTSKASGTITICKGKLLEKGQKTRVVRVNK